MACDRLPPCHATRSTGPTAAHVLGRVTLVTGKEEFLSERTVIGVREAVRRHDAEAEISETQAAGLTLAQLGELAAPSLFSSTRCVVVRGLENLPEESVDGAARLRRGPGRRRRAGAGPRRRAEGLAACSTKLRKLAGVTEVEVRGAPRVRSSRASWPPRCASTAAPSTPRPPRALVQAVGQDLRALAAAADQLVNDFPGEKLTESRRSSATSAAGPRPSRSPWPTRPSGAAADRRWRSCAGRSTAVRRRSWSPPPSPGRPGASPATCRRPAGCASADLAREVGVPPWKLRTIRDQSRGWTEGGIARAIRAVAQADADIKGAASDASYTLERLVLTVTGLRERCLSDPRCRRRRPGGSAPRMRKRGRQSDAARFMIADLRLAAWFLWMTPLETALSSLRAATRPALDRGVLVAGVGGLAELADQRSSASDFTALLRW